MIENPFAWLSLAAYVAAIAQLLTYSKAGARYRPRFSWLAWLFLVILGGSVIELLFNTRMFDLFDAGRATLLSLCVFGVRGNVARLFRSDDQ